MPTDLVTVRQCLTVNEAELAKMELEAAGIRAYITDAATVTMDWLIGNAVGWIKVQVDAAEAEAAREILKGMERLTVAETVTDDEDIECCLACGAQMPDSGSTCSRCGWIYAVYVEFQN
jgi:hypothetical protein